MTTENLYDVKTPFYAAVGAGDLAIAGVNDILTKLRAAADEAAENAQQNFDDARERLVKRQAEAPAAIEELRGKFTPEELRKVAEAYITAATSIYNALAERGEDALGRLHAQDLVEGNVERAEKAYTDAVELTEDALGTVTAQTRAAGERAAKLAAKATGREEVGKAVADAAEKAVDAVEKATAVAVESAKKVAPAAKPAAETPAPAEEKAPAAPAAKKAAPAKKAPAKKAAAPVKKVTPEA